MIHQAYWVIGVTVIGLALSVACLLGAVSQQDSASSVRARLIGTWELVSTVEYWTDGSKRPFPDVGPRGKGFLMYTSDGHMCAAGMNPDRPAWKDVNQPTWKSYAPWRASSAIAGAMKWIPPIKSSITIPRLHWTRAGWGPNKSGHTDSMERS